MIARLLTVLAVLVVLGGSLAYLKYSQIRTQIALHSQPPPAPTVTAATVETRSFRPTLNAIGTVHAVQGVNLNSEVPGQIREILFQSGEMVEAGQLLLRLEDDVDRADLEGLKAAERLAQIQLDRNTKLLRQRAVAQGDVDESSAQLDQARAEVRSKEADIRKKNIRAPFTGQLGIRQVDLGQYLAAGTTIVNLQSLDPVYVDYSLPERQLSRIEVGQDVHIRVAAYPERVFSGHILAIAPQVEQATRHILIRARFDNPDLALRPGMFARVETELSQQQTQLVVPREAITFNTYGDSVYQIVERDGATVVEPRQVRTGAAQDDLVTILEGLAAGDRVVRTGQVKLRNGQAVQVVEEPARSPGSTDTGDTPR